MKTNGNTLESKIEKLSIGGRNQFADCFDNFLDFQLSFFCNNPNDRQKELFDYSLKNPDFKAAMVEAMKAYGDEAEDFKDPLGGIFMSRISHDEKGQFFTPDSVSLLMSEIVGIKDGATVNDPACGSGRTLLNALKVARNEGKDIELYANDLSMTCAKMTLLNMCINLVDGEVTCGDALKLDYENFTFYKLDKLRSLETGAIFTTYWQYTLSNAGEVQEKRNKWWWWIAEHGWVKYFKLPKAPDAVVDCEVVKGEKFECQVTKRGAELIKEKQQIDPLPTEIKADKNGQISLF